MVKMHPRSCSRALGKVVAMKECAVHAADIQRYIIRWGNWWASVGNWTTLSLLHRWTIFTTIHAKEYAWFSCFKKVALRYPTSGVSTTIQCQPSYAG